MYRLVELLRVPSPFGCHAGRAKVSTGDVRVVRAGSVTRLARREGCLASRDTANHRNHGNSQPDKRTEGPQHEKDQPDYAKHEAPPVK
jgi:hypothetical protein